MEKSKPKGIRLIGKAISRAIAPLGILALASCTPREGEFNSNDSIAAFEQALITNYEKYSSGCKFIGDKSAEKFNGKKERPIDPKQNITSYEQIAPAMREAYNLLYKGDVDLISVEIVPKEKLKEIDFMHRDIL